MFSLQLCCSPPLRPSPSLHCCCSDWLEALDTLNTDALRSSPDAATITHCLLSAALVALPTAVLATEAAAAAGVRQLSQAQLRLQALATQLLPLLLSACHRQPPPQLLVLVLSLATVLIER